jgi:hypothetical protein
MVKWALGLTIVGCLVAPGILSAQAKPSAAKSWTPPKTADGQPDLQGYWTNATLTPLERPAQLAGKASLTPEEAAAYVKQVREQGNRDRRGGSAETDVGEAYNDFWFDRGTKIVGSLRTSLIVDPPDGKIPVLTPEAQKRMDDTRAYNREHPADGPENRGLAERCLIWGTAGPPMLPGPYNNAYQIVQNRDYVLLLVEMIHDVRIIPLDGRPHLGGVVRQWMGDSRGHWEGNTLVVDTTDFSGKAPFRGSDQNLHLVERFTRTDVNTMQYEFTVNDPSAFAKPWTAQIPFSTAEGPIFEYACNEGNYAMTDILAGARSQEPKGASR